MVYVSLGEDELRRFAESEARDPAIAKLYSLEREFAETRGGHILEVWKLFQGRIFGLPWMMTLDEVAKRLGITDEEVKAAVAELNEAVVPLWRGTPEYKASPYRVMHERQATPPGLHVVAGHNACDPPGGWATSRSSRCSAWVVSRAPTRPGR